MYIGLFAGSAILVRYCPGLAYRFSGVIPRTPGLRIAAV